MEIVNSVSKDDWEKYVIQFKESNIFHSPHMAKVFELSGFKVYPLFVIHQKQILAAAFPVLVSIKGRDFKFTNRLILYASPLYLDTEMSHEALLLIVESIQTLADKKSLFAEIRNSELFPDDDKGLILNNNWEYIPYENYLIDLSLGEKKIWESISSYARNHVRKSQKKNVTIREVSDKEFFHSVALLKKLYSDKKIFFLGDNVFYNAFEILKKERKIRVIAAFIDEIMIGVRISLNYANTVFDWYGASDRNWSKYYPNEALVWNSIQWGCKNGFKIFDFGGGAIRGQFYGPAKFKEKFKGNKVEFGRYRYICNKLAYRTASAIFELRKRG